MATNDVSAGTAFLPSHRDPVAASALPLGPAVYDGEFSEAPSRRLRDYLRILYKYRWLAAACFGLTLGATVLVTLLTTRLYTAATRLQLSRESPIQLRLDGNVLDLEQSERNVNGTSSFLATQVAALKSRDLAERVIRTPPSRGERGVPASRHPSAAACSRSAASCSAALRPRGIEQPCPPVHDTSARRRDRRRAARSLHALARRPRRARHRSDRGPLHDAGSRRSRRSSRRRTRRPTSRPTRRRASAPTPPPREFLDRQLRESRGNVERAQTALRGFSTEHPNVAVNQEQKVVGQKIGELASLLTKAEGAARHAAEPLSSSCTTPRPSRSPTSSTSPASRSSTWRCSICAPQRAALDGRLGPNHEAMSELGRQEARGRAPARRPRCSTRSTAVRARYDAALAREDGSAHEGRAPRAVGDRAPRPRRALRPPEERRRHRRRRCTRSLLKQQMETAVNSGLAASNIRVIERAEVPERPSTPRIPLNLTLGLDRRPRPGDRRDLALRVLRRQREEQRGDGEAAAAAGARHHPELRARAPRAGVARARARSEPAPGTRAPGAAAPSAGVARELVVAARAAGRRSPRRSARSAPPSCSRRRARRRRCSWSPAPAPARARP